MKYIIETPSAARFGNCVIGEGDTPAQITLYANIEVLRKLIAQAEAEHHQGSLGIVRIALKDSGVENAFDIDMASDLHDRVLVG